MGFKILFVLALSVYAVTAAATTKDEPHKASEGKGDGLPVDWYDCTGREVGNHNHPTTCTKFMACTEGGDAYEMDCALCQPNDPRCPDGRTHYNKAADACLWPDEAGCAGDHQPPTTTTTTEPTPTTGPTPCPLPGEECDPDDCELCGDCHDYVWCERVECDKETDRCDEKRKGTVQPGECKEEHNLFFDPRAKDSDIHGGVCNFWSNLDRDTKRKYNEDEKCINPHCEWKVDPLNEWCAPTYLYFHPDKNEGNETRITCPELDGDQLLWSQADRNCVHCSDLRGEDGNPCPC